MAQTNFTAQIDDWVRKSKDRMTAVFRDAAQTVANDVRTPIAMGGHMPVLTGNLRRSLLASTAEMPKLEGPGGLYSDNSGQITLTIANARLGQKIYLGFQANYAPYQEYGTRYIEPKGFVRLTAQRWQQIVDESTARIRNAVG